MVGLIAPFSATAHAQPVGGEFQVSTYGADARSHGRVSTAVDTAGNFLVAWATNANTGRVSGQFYDSSGSPVGGEFEVVTTHRRSNYGRVAVAADPAGRFLVVWGGEDDAGYVDVFGQRYDNTGAPLGTEFQVNTYTTGSQGGCSLAAASDATGRFIVTWGGWGQNIGNYEVSGQRYDSVGNRLGSEFQVNTYAGEQGAYSGLAVAAGSAGDFVVVWNRTGSEPDDFDVFGQRYDSTGAPQAGEFQVNTYTTGSQGEFGVSVAKNPTGGFVVVWQAVGETHAQRYDSLGNRLGSEFQVNTYTTGIQGVSASVSADPGGNFIVAWGSDGQDGSGVGVFGQRYDSVGNHLGSEFQINTYTTNDQGYVNVSVAAETEGNFVVVWNAQYQGGYDSSVFGQRHAPMSPPSPIPGLTAPGSALLGVLLMLALGRVRFARAECSRPALRTSRQLLPPGDPPV
jgi:hypothetical protein